jgi:nitroreductase
VLIDNLDFLVDHAGRAPSPMNSRPWRFRARTDGVDLLADPSPDPTVQRQHLIGCGAALFNLRLATSHLGVEPAVTLLPDEASPTLLARLVPGARRPAPIDDEDLLSAIVHRRTRREPFDRGYLPHALVDHLAAAVATEGATLLSVPSGPRRAVLDAALSRAQVDAAADPAHQAGLRAPWSHGTAATAIGVLCTHADVPADWLRAGQALQRLLLTATTAWVQARVFTRALEDPAQRQALREQVCGERFPQLVLELGPLTDLSG